MTFIRTQVGPWGPCHPSNTQARDEVWTEEIPEEIDGPAGPTTERRIGTQPCSYQLPRLLATDLTYEGSFRVPLGAGQTSYNYGGFALTYWPDHDSLLMMGNDTYQRIGEIAIPPLGQGSVSSLPRATVLQPLTDILAGRREDVDGSPGARIGAITIIGGKLVVAVWSYYDNQGQKRSHFLTAADFAAITPADVAGPFQVGTGWQAFNPNDQTRIAGFVSGYMCTIPPYWQTLLGGTHLTGQGGGVSILNRTSSGPSATVFSPVELAELTPARLVMGYPQGSGNQVNLNHPTLGVWGQNVAGKLYNGTQGFRGMVFPEGTRSILFPGWGGDRFSYGVGTSDIALDLTPVPSDPAVLYCYDPANSSKGTHNFGVTISPSGIRTPIPPYSLIFAYDAEDFLAARLGTKAPWEVVPYTTWKLHPPYQHDLGRKDIVGVAWDPSTRRLFLSAAWQDGAAPIVHVYHVT